MRRRDSEKSVKKKRERKRREMSRRNREGSKRSAEMRVVRNESVTKKRKEGEKNAVVARENLVSYLVWILLVFAYVVSVGKSLTIEQDVTQQEVITLKGSSC